MSDPGPTIRHNEHFEDKLVLILEGDEYHNCTFHECMIVRGDNVKRFLMKDCKFDTCSFDPAFESDLKRDGWGGAR